MLRSATVGRQAVKGFQLPVLVRQHAIQKSFAGTGVNVLLIRSFHSSPPFELQKPASSVVKPNQSNKPKKSPTKQRALPAKTVTEKTTPTVRPTASTHAQSSNPEPTATTPSPVAVATPSGLKPSQIEKPVAFNEHVPDSLNPQSPLSLKSAEQFMHALAINRDPTVLYQAAPRTQFATISYTSSIYMLWVGYVNYNLFAAFPDLWKLLAGSVIASFFGGCGLFLGLAPSKMIDKITAIPVAKTGPVYTGNRQPQLDIEFGRPLPFMRKRSITVPLWEVSRNSSVELRYEAACYWLPPKTATWPARFFGSATKMFTRRSVMAPIRVKGATGMWKLDMHNAEVLHNGAALDAIIPQRTEKWEYFFYAA